MTHAINLSQHGKFVECIGPTGAGTSSVNGTAVDMSGYESVTFVVKFGTGANDNRVHAEQGSQSDGSDAADLAASEVVPTNSEPRQVLTVHKPKGDLGRYVRPVVVRGTSTTIDWCIAILTGPRTRPVSNSDGTNWLAESHVTPELGTK